MISRYAQKLRDDRWRDKREQIIARDGNACVRCGATGISLHVHHKHYSGEPWDAPDDDLQTLCVHCHGALGAHNKGGIWWSDDGDGLAYSGKCPKCGSDNMKDKGSYDVCRDCGHEVSFLGGTA